MAAANTGMAEPTATTWRYLSPNPESCYRQLFVKGTRTRAHVIYGMFMSTDEPMKPAEIAEDLGLPLEAVHEAIAYCQSDPPEIARDFESKERLATASRKPGGIPPQEVARILNT
jgi:uncharacterized protein (DUF433 family)